MAGKDIEIKAISYVHVGDELVEFSQLTQEQKRKAATWLKCTYLNALYAGQARFSPKGSA